MKNWCKRKDEDRYTASTDSTGQWKGYLLCGPTGKSGVYQSYENIDANNEPFYFSAKPEVKPFGKGMFNSEGVYDNDGMLFVNIYKLMPIKYPCPV